MTEYYDIFSPRLAEKIIWNDTAQDFYSPENIARRLLFLKRGDNVDSQIGELLGLSETQILSAHNRNASALMSAIKAKSIMVENFMTKPNELPESFDPRCDPYVARAFGMTMSEFNSVDYWRCYTNSQNYRYRDDPNYRNKFN